MNSSYSSRLGHGLPRLSSTLGTALVVVLAIAGIGVSLWAVGLIDLSRFRSPSRSLAGLVAIPTPAVRIPAHSRVTRDHFWDAKNQRFTFIYLQPRSVTKEMYTSLGDIIGRVLDHDKQPGYVFTESDFLPKGTREGIVACIPAGKRAVRVPA